MDLSTTARMCPSIEPTFRRSRVSSGNVLSNRPVEVQCSSNEFGKCAMLLSTGTSAILQREPQLFCPMVSQRFDEPLLWDFRGPAPNHLCFQATHQTQIGLRHLPKDSRV